MTGHTDTMSSGDLFLHVGYHKTGTTFLQKQIFAKASGLNYLGRSWKDPRFNQFFKDFAFVNDLTFYPEREADRFNSILAHHVRQNGLDPSFPSLVSHESLMTGPEWFGAEVKTRAARLKSTFPDARIIIGLRGQAEFIDSNYRQYVILGGKMSFDRFLKNSMAAEYGLLPRLEYDKVIQYYFDLFGLDRVHVYLLEEMKLNSAGVVSEMLRFMKIDQDVELVLNNTNKGISRFSINAIRFVNRLLLDDSSEQYYRWVNQDVGTIEALRWRMIRLIKRLEKNGRPGNFVTPEYRIEIRSRFRESNERLAAMLGKELSDLGY